MSSIWSLSLMMMFVMMCTMHFYPQTEATPIQKPRTRSQTFYPNGRYGRADPDLSSDINENALEEERSRVMVASSGQPARSGSQALNCWYTGVGAFFQCYRSFSSSTPPLPRSISISSGLDNILNNKM